ncbi:aminotransferase class I/II-fold pyridoxal phosphate-dependent enzyme [Nocardioides marmoriginsengisoli]|uniref:Aminotransferase class I/II-fold pyridoxal phosphate-dependent enzyme n=1 Tax=Nocardioides marmoriginsengisoli TaxID=661483 RepID=A0A3N0CLN6_9ACTN|nr:aminotransferase class I/II-fold pyridoxal phosphate-dependent enzyme [Nocardioides marmoriginsengisoli]RNL64377.1 aminotransferase class I/II-fold pyridoxal phosphate-dependent enzyme [Nocardioides marmoriginsengisoli]
MLTPRELASVIESRIEDPTARGLARAVSRAVGAGELPIGTKLPTIRYLAHELGVSTTTITASWNLLIRSGTIRTEGRRGTFVAEPAASGAIRYRRAIPRAHELTLDLSGGLPDPELLPDVSRAVRDLRVAGSSLNYLDEPVLTDLARVLIASWPYDVPEVAIADGALDALDQIGRSLFQLGDRVLVEDPTFPTVVDQAEATGAEVVGVALDQEGLVPDQLRLALERPARAVIIQTRGQNPTGAALTPRRAAELAEILRGTGTYVIEDDSAGGISSAPDVSLGSLLPEQTLHVRSFSKSHGPDLRLAAFSAPEEVLGDIQGRRQLGQGWSSRLLQQILLHLLTDEASQAEVDAARAEYARRRSGLTASLRERGIDIVDGDGLNLWLPVRDETAAALYLATLGVGVAAGAPFTVTPGAPHLRVSVGEARSDLEDLAGILAHAAGIEVGAMTR